MTADTVIEAVTIEEQRRQSLLAKIDHIHELEQQTITAGAKYMERHHERGKLWARERVELLIDEGSAFLELGTLVGFGQNQALGGALVTGIGVVEGVECMIIASDPTIKGGALTPLGLKKGFRASQIAEENNLPVINLVESGGADLPNQKDIFIPGGRAFRNITNASAHRIPTIAVVFGNCTAGGAYIPGMSDYVVMIKERSKVFLAGPPLVKMATGEVSDDETLGGAEMHSKVSGLSDYLAEDEYDAIRLARRIVSRLNFRKKGHVPALTFAEPDLDPEGLLDVIPTDVKEPFDPREAILRIVDGTSEDNGSPYDEFKPLYGSSLSTGWARLHGHQIGIIANVRGILFSQEAQKAAQFIQLCNQKDTPILFLVNTTGYMVGAEYEQGGIIKHGAMMVNAVANSKVPHLTVNIGGSFGAGNYGMSGRAYDPRFLFAWPNSKSSVMGSEQLAGVMEIVSREAAAKKGQPFNEEEFAGIKAFVTASIDEQAVPEFMSGMGYDDGVIDPRDTRTVLAICLSVIANLPIKGVEGGFGVFRM